MRGLLVLLACVPAFAVAISAEELETDQINFPTSLPREHVQSFKKPPGSQSKSAPNKEASKVRPASSVKPSSTSTPGASTVGNGTTGLVDIGQKTPIETVPWHAGIYMEEDGDKKFMCGGSLVSLCVVVTTAHCVERGKIFVALGKYLSSWDSESGSNIHKSQVKNITKHPYFRGRPTNQAYDVAVLELEHCSPTHDKIVPVCIDKNIQPSPLVAIKVPGWGGVSATPVEELKSATLTPLDLEDCLNAVSDGQQIKFLTHDKFCATRPAGTPPSAGLLLGDSGGGAVVLQAGSWYLAGLASSHFKTDTNDDVYGFTKLSEYVDWIRKFAVAPESCGKTSSDSKGVEKAPIETVPWHAGIYMEEDGDKKFMCGGSLVSPCVVVTTAHCVERGKIFVALGKYLSSWDSESGKSIHKTKVKNITKDPRFKGKATSLAFDIAVLELEHCSPVNNKIAPICMDKNIEPVSSADIKVPGWGNESGEPLEELKSVTMTQLNFEDCLNALSDTPGIEYLTHDKFCARRRPGTPRAAGLVQGDSGGGAVVRRGGSWYLTGVAATRLSSKNDEDVYGFTKLSEYVDWIRKFGASSESCRRTDNGPASPAQKGACGRAGGGPSSLVLSGEKTPVETVPWQAGIFVEKDGLLNVCGGTLVSPCVVVTAAHCIPEGRKIFVALGKYLSGWDLESGKNIHKTQVKKITKHPYFKGHLTKMAFDIAVLELENCSPINSKISPICMDKTIQPVSSTNIKVAGWGNETTPLMELESVTLTQLNFFDCLNIMSNNAGQAAYITSDKFCATRRKGSPQSGLLMGDSGGAALVKQGGSWYMTGVVSGRLKDENNEDVYALTKVSEYVDWIRTFI